MNPRLTVSVLFVLFAIVAFRPQADGACKKLNTLQHCWAGMAPDRCAGEILNCIASRVSALKSEFLGHKGIVTPLSVLGDRPVRRVTNLIDSDSHSPAFERVRTAVWQIEEVLDLIRTK